MVRHDQQYELTLQAESLAVSGGRLPAAEGDEGEGNERNEKPLPSMGTLAGD